MKLFAQVLSFSAFVLELVVVGLCDGVLVLVEFCLLPGELQFVVRLLVCQLQAFLLKLLFKVREVLGLGFEFGS